MTALKVGDYVQAIMMTHIAFEESGADMQREGIIIEVHDGGSTLVLETWQNNEFRCHAQCAKVVDESALDQMVKDFLVMARLRLEIAHV